MIAPHKSCSRETRARSYVGSAGLEAHEEIELRDLGFALVGHSPPMVELAARIDTVAESGAPVVIMGESGTGKELVARLIHGRGARQARPFVAVNCAAFPETLLEAELFGHERGAFTGAMKKRDGRFKAAGGGTLLLDEIGEVPLSAQVRLLRVLQEKAVEPLGSDSPVSVDVRVIAATHRSLRDLVAAGRFREDLFFRLNVLEIDIPPLRERKSDLVPLLAYFLKLLTPAGSVPPPMAPRAWAALTQYSYPGNVREFAHAIERSLVLSNGHEIDLEHLPPEISGAMPPSRLPAAPSCRPLSVALDEFEREYLLRALRQASTRTGAAEMLRISRKGLWEKLRKHKISDADVSRAPESGVHLAGAGR
jgi:DNA-binding NtrC family response regulator